MILTSLNVKDYIGKNVEIDCKKIKLTFENSIVDDLPLFEGPGTIKLEKTGKIKYKLFNKIPVDQKIFSYLKSKDDPNTDIKAIACRVEAESYSGIKWTGSFNIPEVKTYSGSSNILITGLFDQLSTFTTHKGKREKPSSEVFFFDCADLPYEDNLKITASRGDDIVFIKHRYDHQIINLDGEEISFTKDTDELYLQVTATHTSEYSSYMENWLVEALSVSIGKTMYPRIVIRHNEDSDIIFIRYIPDNSPTMMMAAFPTYSVKEKEFWKFFCAYLKKVKEIHKWENLNLTTGFYETCLAGRGTLQNFLTSLSVYIENCISFVFDGEEDEINKESIQLLVDAVKKCEIPSEDNEIKQRALGLLSMLNSPATAKRMKKLKDDGVITEEQVRAWQKVRPKLAHGNVLTPGQGEEFFKYKNHLICMMYRLIFKIVNYSGFALEYIEKNKSFKYVEFKKNKS